MRGLRISIWGVVFSLVACSEGTNDSVESRTSAITAAEARMQRILGFEAVSDWTVVNGPGTLSSTTTRTEGAAALAARVQNYNAIRSAPLGPLGLIGTSVSYDVFVPLQPSPPQWMGETQLFIDCPSRGIFNQFLGQRNLVDFPRGKYSEVRYNVPAAIRSALNGHTYTDLRFTVVLNVPSNAKEIYRLDRFTVTPCGTGGLAPDGSCQEAAPDVRVVSAADVANQGPTFASVSAAINYIAAKVQADPSLGTVRVIEKDESGVPVSISVQQAEVGPVAVVEANRTLTLYPSRLALMLGGRAGWISLTGGQRVCLQNRCDPVCPLGMEVGESGDCVCAGGQTTLPDSTCVCTDGHMLIEGTCQCPPDSFLSETGECVPLAEASVFLLESESECNLEFCGTEHSYHSEFIPTIAQWILDRAAANELGNGADSGRRRLPGVPAVLLEVGDHPVGVHPGNGHELRTDQHACALWHRKLGGFHAPRNRFRGYHYRVHILVRRRGYQLRRRHRGRNRCQLQLPGVLHRRRVRGGFHGRQQHEPNGAGQPVH